MVSSQPATATDQASKWLLRPPSADAGARLFCFPYSGVGGSMFARWPRRIGDAEVCPVQPPARENRLREPHFGTYQEFADSLVAALRPLLDRPFAFFGHCAGALPAFETARLLDELGLRGADRLFVSAQVAPHQCPFDRFLELDDAGLTAELGELTKAMGGKPEPALLELALSVLHQDLEANRVYRRESPAGVSAGITLVHWAADAEIDAAQLDGWREYSEDVRYAEVPGGHYDFLSAPEALLDVIRRDWAGEHESTS